MVKGTVLDGVRYLRCSALPETQLQQPVKVLSCILQSMGVSNSEAFVDENIQFLWVL